MDKINPALRKKKHALFCLNFLNHVYAFINQHGLSHPHRKMAVSVSAGVDSMALANILYDLKFDIELIHFNHGTRVEENKREEEMVQSFALQKNLKVHIFSLNLSLKDNNFEKNARQLRQKIYRDFIEKNYWVYTAHHIDDSFEWSLMQSFKQSSIESALGIPVFNNGLVKPFMCVTKKQIKRFARAKGLKWLEDSSNENDMFERNFLRQHITKTIYKKYPQVLAHYVSRNNQLVNELKLQKDNCTDALYNIVIKKEAGGIVLVTNNLGQHKAEIKKNLYQLSTKNRGEIDQEINKLIKVQQEILSNSKSLPFKGPMNFSGGVSFYLMKDHLLMMSKQHRDFYMRLDQQLQKKLESLSQIPHRVLLSEYPYLFVSFRKKLIKSSKFIHPLLPITSLWLKNQSISYSFTPVMCVSDRQLLAFDALILDSSIVGL
jgi:tRNA(Ile)-lysidine synthase